MNIVIGFETLDIRVRPSPETNDHEVCLLGDGEDLIARFWHGLIGLDPDDLLVEPSGLSPTSEPHKVTVARCDCGVIGCGSAEVEVSTIGDDVFWIDGDRSLRFRREQYAREVTRAMSDMSWETPDRTAARLVRTGVDRPALAQHGLTFLWASGRVGAHSFTVALHLTSGPYQILVTLPWSRETPDEIASAAIELLRRDPRTWESVGYFPQSAQLPPPSIGGGGWRRGTR